jgi:hypothetical protein
MFVRERQDGFFRRNESNFSLFFSWSFKRKMGNPGYLLFYSKEFGCCLCFRDVIVHFLLYSSLFFCYLGIFLA